MVPLLSRGIIAPVFALACLAALPVEADQISDQVFEVPPLRGETVRVTNEQIDLLVQAQPDALVLDPASLSRLRAQVRDVLLERALLERGALEAGLNYDARVQQELEAARQSVLAAAFLRQLSDPSSVTDAEIEAEYQRAIEQLADVEYQMRRLTFLSREEAQAAADALNADTDFLEVMGSFGGIHPADGAPGKWRWIAASRMPLPVRENIRLQASDPTLGASPVLVEGTWYVLQVQDQRGAEVPKLAEIENVLREQIAQARAQTWLRERQEQEMIREDDGQSAVLATGG
ncbi:MAG: peptidyl-prolyl cis-trans isomerase, partial [Pseudomonadota bacterium]